MWLFEFAVILLTVGIAAWVTALLGVTVVCGIHAYRSWRDYPTARVAKITPSLGKRIRGWSAHSNKEVTINWDAMSMFMKPHVGCPDTCVWNVEMNLRIARVKGDAREVQRLTEELKKVRVGTDCLKVAS